MFQVFCANKHVYKHFAISQVVHDTNQFVHNKKHPSNVLSPRRYKTFYPHYNALQYLEFVMIQAYKSDHI